MTLKIDDAKISSPDTWHQAIRVTSTAWEVTWRPRGERLTRNQAITAMMIASTVGASDHQMPHDDSMWPHVNSWAAELGLDGDHAAAYAARPWFWDPAGLEADAAVGEGGELPAVEAGFIRGVVPVRRRRAGTIGLDRHGTASP